MSFFGVQLILAYSNSNGKFNLFELQRDSNYRKYFRKVSLWRGLRINSNYRKTRIIEVGISESPLYFTFNHGPEEEVEDSSDLFWNENFTGVRQNWKFRIIYMHFYVFNFSIRQIKSSPKITFWSFAMN